jgi:hypothetical protein
MKRWVQLARNLSSFSAGDFIYHGDLYTRVVYIPWSLYTMEFVYHGSGSLYTMVQTVQ